jgi:HD-GYP domain-containing protein (c-di-GMP phosphodiesterase class II)
VKAALTMNLGMLELQERLSNQARLPDPTQRRAIHAHPLTSMQMLKNSGIADDEWLQAVAQHHEQPNGGGYPTATTRITDMANALRVIDVYTAKLAGRSGRDALPPERALRDLMVVERGNPFAIALGAEFGRHPPGSLVRLHSGEVGVVVRRGEDTAALRVAVLVSRRGEPLAEPVVREAVGRENGIAGDVEPRGLRAPIVPEQLFAKAGA